MHAGLGMGRQDRTSQESQDRQAKHAISRAQREVICGHLHSQLVPATRFYVEQHNGVPVALSGRGRPADWLGDDDAAVRAHYRRLRAGCWGGVWRRVHALVGLK